MRFTQTRDAFYILSLTRPAEKLLVKVPLPILAGDSVKMLGPGSGTKVEWEPLDTGISIAVPDALAEEGRYCWVFKIEYA